MKFDVVWVFLILSFLLAWFGLVFVVVLRLFGFGFCWFVFSPPVTQCLLCEETQGNNQGAVAFTHLV